MAQLRLSALYTCDGLLADRDGDGLPDTVRARLIPGPTAALPEHLALVDVAARLGFESMALPLPLVCSDVDELPPDAIPVFIGRPSTVSLACPAHLRDALSALRAGEGLVALSMESPPALLLGGADATGLAGAARVLSAYLPRMQPDDAPMQSLDEVCQALSDACNGAAVTPVVEALVVRGSRVAEAHLRAVVPPADMRMVRRACEALAGSAALPCDLVLTFDTGAGDAITLRIAGPAPRDESRPRRGVPATSALPRTDTEPAVALPRSLAGLYGPDGLALDSDGDLLPDSPRARLLLPDDLTPRDAAEAAHLGARLGLETLGLALPLAHADGTAQREPGRIDVRIAPLNQAVGQGIGVGEGELGLLDAPEGGRMLEIRGGDAHGRALALRELALLDTFDAPAGTPSLDAVQQALQRLCALADQPAWACAALAAMEQLPAQALRPSPEPLSLGVALPALAPETRAAMQRCMAERIRVRAPEASLDVHVSEAIAATVLDETHRLVWEVDDAWAHLEAEALPALAALPPGNHDWLLDVRLGEPEGRRRQLKRELLQHIRATGVAVRDDQVRVLPAYRQGRTWLLEEVAPHLQGRNVATLLIRVQHFTRDYPCLELPIRWLQDLHPVDELLGERLGLPREAVRFELADQPHTYDVEARNAAGGVVWRGWFDVIHGERPYLHGFPAWGIVHPPTGGVRLLVDGRPVVDARVAPDPERVWDLVQTSLLPRLREHILAVSGGAPRPDEQPFFDSLTVEAWLSEEDSALGLREERVSSLESLHEDLYFMLLDYCCALMAASDGAGAYLPPWVRPRGAHEPQRGARLWTAPGRIVPSIHRADGAAGRVRLHLAAAPERRPHLAWRRGTENGVVPLRPASGVTARVSGLRLSTTAPGAATPDILDAATPATPNALKLAAPDAPRPSALDTLTPARRLLVELDGPPAEREQARRMLVGWAALRAAGAFGDDAIPACWALTIHDGAGESLDIAAAQTGPPVSMGTGVERHQEFGRPGNESTVPGNGPTVPRDRVLGLAEVQESLRALAPSPYVRAYQAGRSARGRPSYAVELTVPRGAGLWSRAKLSAWKCTLLLNARHHANEPSSTSALLRLADLLAHDASWRRYLARINVVLIPCENPDGAALHEALQAEHPTWMLHAARYNDAGLEFTGQYTNPHTRHSEALVLPALWRRWAPDVVCDEHGFPSHEWAQPFAGHSNPWFQSHWISQGLIYLILPRIANPRYVRHAEALESLQRRLVRALADDPAVRARNGVFADRYRTFLSDRLPERFPAHFEDDVLIHRVDYDPDDPAQTRASLAGLPGAHPGVTTASLITEVADETAQGRYMALCAHTHLLADRALLDYLYDANAPAAIRREHYVLPDGAIVLRAVRPRPVLAGDAPVPERPPIPSS